MDRRGHHYHFLCWRNLMDQQVPRRHALRWTKPESMPTRTATPKKAPIRRRPEGSNPGAGVLTALSTATYLGRVEAARQPQERQGECATTLGDVLYANKARAPVPEQDWVTLVQAIAHGDQLALHALYAQTHRLVFTLILRLTSNRETAEELTLDVFHDVWRRAATYDPDGGSVVGWILNQARSRAIDRMRFEQRKKRAPTGPEGPHLPPSDAHEALDLREQGRLLRTALQALTRDERQAVETAFFGELTYAETAARLNQPVGTVKTRIRSALRKLRRALAGPVTSR
jgi:RNA polymerase sigma-70 factor, ECF subfamily